MLLDVALDEDVADATVTVLDDTLTEVLVVEDELLDVADEALWLDAPPVPALVDAAPPLPPEPPLEPQASRKHTAKRRGRCALVMRQ